MIFPKQKIIQAKDKAKYTWYMYVIFPILINTLELYSELRKNT